MCVWVCVCTGESRGGGDELLVVLELYLFLSDFCPSFVAFPPCLHFIFFILDHKDLHTQTHTRIHGHTVRPCFMGKCILASVCA